MAVTGIKVNRLQLIDRLNSQIVSATTEVYEAEARKRAAVTQNRKELIVRLAFRLKELRGGREDPGSDNTGVYHYGRYNNYDTTTLYKPPTKAERTATIESAIEPIKRAIRIFEMSDEDTVTLGPKLIQDLGLGEYL